MNVRRFLEIMEVKEPPEKAREREKKIAALNAEIAEKQSKLSSPGLPPSLFFDDEALKNHISLQVEIQSHQWEIYRLTYIEPAFGAGFEQGRAYERFMAASRKASEANSPWSKSRYYCLCRATEIWAKPPIKRIGEVARILFEELALKRLKCPIKAEQIHKWLKDAAKENIPEEYRLIIPPEAQKKDAHPRLRNPPTAGGIPIYR